MALCDSCNKLDLRHYQRSGLSSASGCPNQEWHFDKAEDVYFSVRELPRYCVLIGAATDGCLGCVFFKTALEPFKKIIADERQRMFIQNLSKQPLVWKLVSDLPPWLPEAGSLIRNHGQIDIKVGPDHEKSFFKEDSRHLFLGETIKFDLCVDQEWYTKYPNQRSLCCTTIPEYPLSPSCVCIMKVWIDTCLSREHDCFKPDGKLPKRLVYIPSSSNDPIRLIESSSQTAGGYLALSHCWGGFINIRLTHDTMQQLFTELPFDTLPPTFRDAVSVTRSLGFSHLWIDALCIIQDSEDDWSEQAACMGSIYQNATATISAASASSSKDGFLHARSSCSPAFGPSELFSLRNSRKDFIYSTSFCKLYTRGWISQESLMSGRILHFTPDEIHWECSCAVHNEGMPNCNILPGVSYRKMLMQSALHSGSSLSFSELHGLWTDCVTNFSHRELSYGKDKLPAMSALASSINRDGRLGVYCAGLWSNTIFGEMSWGMLTGPQIGPMVANTGRLTISDTWRAPTWSWAAYDGEVIIPTTQSRLGHPPQEGSRNHEEWSSKYAPKLVAVNMLLKDAGKPYMELKYGSNIIVEGSYYPVSFSAESSISFNCEFNENMISSIIFDATIKDTDLPKANQVYMVILLDIYIYDNNTGGIITTLVVEDSDTSWK